jgi:transposase
MNNKFTINDFRKRFPNDDACLSELMIRKFGTNPKCPNTFCGKTTKFHRVASRKCYECQWCGTQVYPTAGTVLEGTTTSLVDWFYVMYLMTTTRSGVSAKKVEQQLGVTYKTAWRMCNMIRRAMDEKPALKNQVELNSDL